MNQREIELRLQLKDLGIFYFHNHSLIEQELRREELFLKLTGTNYYFHRSVSSPGPHFYSAWFFFDIHSGSSSIKRVELFDILEFLPPDMQEKIIFNFDFFGSKIAYK